MNRRPPFDPTHYWRIASDALIEEQTTRLRAMRESDGLQALNRLTQGTQIRRAAGIERDSELVRVAALFQHAYETKKTGCNARDKV